MPDRPIEQFAKQIEDLFIQYGGPTVNYNFSPILHRYISKHSSVKCYGIFETNDASEFGEMSYITFWRNDQTAIAHDGVGLAWRVGDGTKYNIYLVDNDVLQEEVYIGEGIVREDMGINNYLASAKFEILVDTRYNFSLKITEDYAIVAKIWKIGDNEPSDSASPDADYIIVSTGAKALPYRTEAESNYQFGISIPETNGGEWLYDDIIIQSLTPGIPYNIFQIKADTSYFVDKATFKYHGYAYDQNLNYGVKAYLLKNDASWLELGSNASTSATSIAQTEISFTTDVVTDYMYNGYFYLAAAPVHTSGEQTVRSYYVSAENVVASGLNIGGMIDVYVEAPEKIIETTVDLAISSGQIQINSTNFNTPIQEIVELSDINDDILDRSTYTLVTSQVGTAYTNSPNQYISFAPPKDVSTETITIRYRYYSDGGSVETLLQSDDYRNPGVDLKVKVMPPYVVSVENLDFRGLVSVDQVKESIKTFVNGLGASLEISDLLNYLYSVGVNYINLDTLDINIRTYDYTNTMLTAGDINLTDSYTVAGLGGFFSHTSDLLGVNKLD